MKLSYEQKKHFIEHGYVKIPGVIPKIMIDEAIKAINHSIGEGMNVEDMPQFRAQTFCPEIASTPVIMDLFRKTPAWQMAIEAIGEGIDYDQEGQIALRFPKIDDPPRKAVPHLDGMYTPTNGVEEGTIANFTALVGILLSDLPETNAGNFTVWADTHRMYEKYFQEHGPEALLKGMPPIELPEPTQITGKAGDIVLVHYQLAHGIAPNVSPFTRYAIFFRLFHRHHHLDWKAPMKDIWLHWEGMKEVLAKESTIR